MRINALINELLAYALEKGILEEADYAYATNLLIDFFGEKGFTKEEIKARDLDAILDDLTAYALENGILGEDDIVSRDNFKAKTIDLLMDRPKEVIRKFHAFYKESPRKATDYLYKLSKDVNYIQTKRIAQNIKWKHGAEYGTIDLTINLSKPEKDPRLIALQKGQKSGYPKCHLCLENEGYRGHIGYDGRSNLRIIPLNLNSEPWFFQYSPYSYFEEHSIVLNKEHVPMVINRGTFIKLADFLDYFPEYFVGSNAELPIVGGSILNHEHYQSGRYRFPIEDAEAEFFRKAGDVEVYALRWPLSTVRIKSRNRESLIDYAAHILDAWREYENKDLLIVNSKEEPHNTITPISRKEEEFYVFDLILRNNHTTEDRPDGVFHPRQAFHHIKKENIGLIEAMGLGILPGRLKTEFDLIGRFLSGDEEAGRDERLKKHWHWVERIKDRYNPETDAAGFVLEEAGKVFSEVLKDAGVFKMDEEGQQAFREFLKSL
ncbi:MAG: UDP-glucose--hexose-1-phosphate uridylyltransferase [Bacilli bacterium]|jgi:UDPglucose--hexose-1-phosphate uridylyltransferase|nr:UDP-glucose--hexose-1-phosphate uridylyltransferase [Acholeplasmataceae bacterium]